MSKFKNELIPLTCLYSYTLAYNTANIVPIIKIFIAPVITSAFTDSYKAEFFVKTALNAYLAKQFTFYTILDAAEVGMKYLLSDDINSKFKHDLTSLSNAFLSMCSVLGAGIILGDTTSYESIIIVKSFIIPVIISTFTDSYKAEFLVQIATNIATNAYLYHKDNIEFFALLTICDAAKVGIKYLLSNDIQNNEIFIEESVVTDSQ